MNRPAHTMNETNKALKQPEVKTVWQSGWCSVGGNQEKFQARVGKSNEGFHAGVATCGSQKMSVAWGPATPDQQGAKEIAQVATSQALGRKAAAKEFTSGTPHISPVSRGRSR